MAHDGPGIIRPDLGDEDANGTYHAIGGDLTELVTAIRKIMDEMGAIPKGSTSPASAGNYQYRGVEAITARLQPLMAKHGVVIVPISRVLDVYPSPSMPQGWLDTSLVVTWRIIGPDGGWMLARTTGFGRDKSDKGSNKAQTQAFKYLLLQLFCISDGEADSDGMAYEPHVEVAEVKVASKAVRDGLMARITALDAEAQKEMVAWFHENEIPAIKKLPEGFVDTVDAIIDHYENLDTVKNEERDGTA